MFEVYKKSVKNFKDWYYLVNPLTKVALANTCNLDLSFLVNVRTNSPSFWVQNHFLENVESYAYKLDNMSHKETCMNMKLVAFFEDLGYVDSVVAKETKEVIHIDTFDS